MLFGISPSPEIFQARMHVLVEGLPGVEFIVDDILVSGSGETTAAAEADHDHNVERETYT